MIKIDGLVKNYGDFKLDISMKLPAGHVSGIVGRNGAGKSTAIKAILGLIAPDAGSVYTLGKNAAKLSAEDRKLIGVAMSDSGFSSYLSVRDISKILAGMYKDFDPNGFLRKCGENGLPENKKIHDFSTGMRAKLKVLIACSHNAKLLIMDEPTAGLDVVARGEVLDMLRKYLAEDPERSLLISSHISSDLEGICDDIYMIQDGKIIFREDTDVILSDYALLKLSREAYESIDKSHFIKVREESYGYSCLTDSRQYYAENYPDAAMESGSIDDVILMLSEGRD